MYDFMDRSAVKALRRRGYSFSRIARELGHDRRTVRRLLNEPVDKKYSRAPTWSPVDVFREQIMEWLGRNIPVQRMLEMAQEDPDHPFRGSRTAFYRRVKMFREEMKANKRDVWVRFEGLPGEYLQVDWGEVRNFPFLVQKRATRYFFCARLKYSRFSYVEFTDNMKQETLLRCLIRCFEAIGGIPWVCVFDNMKTISPGRDGNGVVIWNETFARFAAEMEFHPEACHPYSANQKGTVENLVGWVKSSFFPGREFLDDDDLEDQCRKWLVRSNNSVSQAHGKIPAGLLEEEREKLIPLRESASSYGFLRNVAVGPESLVNIDGGRYSVPVGYVGGILAARIREQSIDFYDGADLVASHTRRRSGPKRVINPEHFEEIFNRKPRSRVMVYRDYLLERDPSIRGYIEKLCRRFRGCYGPHIIRMYELFNRYGADELGCACALASEHGAYGADYLVSLLRKPRVIPVVADVELKDVPLQDEVDRTLEFYEAFAIGGAGQ